VDHVGQGELEKLDYPALRTFLLAAAKDQPRLRLALDAHFTLAFAAGSVINIKSGRQVELEQRSTGRRLWSADDVTPDPTSPSRSGLRMTYRRTCADIANPPFRMSGRS
jgi:hypothetical protein